MSNLFDLSGKTAIITGSSRGIGKAIAEQMAAHGAKVVSSSRKLAACEAVADAINKQHGEGTAMADQVAAELAGHRGTERELTVLTDVLHMPFGLEMYLLLTRWNPLNVKRPVALPYNGKKVLVVGMGPAGYTLAHYLLNEGFAVFGIDALKIEPLPPELTGDAKLLP